jgi:starch synthase
VRALRYGVVPLALSCGGLHQFVQDYDPVNGSGNGFVFYLPTVAALVDGIRRAVAAKQSQEAWNVLTDRANGADFSWAAAAKSHEALYAGALRKAGVPIAA